MQELFSDMRICLNQKPNSSQGFGFQTNWDSTGASIRSIQEGSPAELCQLRVGDEVLAVSGHKVSNMTYEQWKGAMDAALQKGCLVMDIRRHGKNNWGRDQPSLPYKSHKTINLTSMDPTLVGSPEKYINTCSEFNLQSSESTVKAPITSSQPVNDLESKDMNGGFREESVTMRNKDSEPISLKNLKRRSEFFEQQGGSESAISDLQVPSISTSSNRWSWDSEDERRRQEKWQKEQERLLQEKYKRDQEKLDEEFRRAQLEATKEAPPPSLDDPTQHEQEQRQQSELEERKRRERQEQLQREEKERQRRAEEMRQQRMREEEEAERRRLEEERRRQEAAEEQEHERMQQQWAKSKSTPELDEVDKEEGRVVNSGAPDVSWSRDSQRKADQPVSQAEHERQQIIEEMKKKTPLLTDNSWIRQSTPSAGKDPIRRGESLDNLDLRPPSWSAGTPSYSRPQSATSGSTSARPYPRSASTNTLPTSFSTSSMRQSPWAQPPSTSPTPPAASNVDPFSDPNSSSQRNRSVSGKKICTFCDNPLGRGAAMIIESLGLCYHLGCFKCIDCKSDLGGSESGAEVRIRNRQLYCNSCYVRFKTGQPTTM
ncbi:hypothetical protein AGOR_G00063300 [Albula goreensis]|uniref:LIM domain only protein 7 n=1 Tax=Albula goreensis TaxID=1534307 RepID=A0A8T3DUS6_9TELE|nr:hypothetical protein AGOR_G00063300 [Albula goreensis]